MFWALAVILVAVAGSHLAVIRRRRPAPGAVALPVGEQLRGFVYVGSGALACLAVAVVVLGLTGNRRGLAEGLAVLGLLAYLAYLLAAFGLLCLARPRRAGRYRRTG